MSAPIVEGFLQRMARSSRSRADLLARRCPGGTLARLARSAAPPRPLVLSPEGFDLLAEVKFASPSAGALRAASSAEALQRARAYRQAGACAISVLTEPTVFSGSLEHLAAVAGALDAPVLCKDFLVDPLQLLEARAAGASGVLLVARMLDEAQLDELLDCAEEAGLFVLLEAFDSDDLGRIAPRAAATRRIPLLVGVNARDLETLAVTRGKHLELAPELPAGVTCVAESGICVASAARAAAGAGYRLALVGSALMRAADPAALARSLLAAGRGVQR